MRSGRRLRLALAVALFLTATLASNGVASADLWGPPGAASDTYWDSATGNVLGTSKIAHGNIVGFWQGYLKAYNMIGACGIDGHFGAGTANATASMQSFLGLPADGVVGPTTWDAASRWITYNGPTGEFRFWRPAFQSDGWAVLYAQKAGGPYTGYWYWLSMRTQPKGVNINTGLGAPTFRPSC